MNQDSPPPRALHGPANPVSKDREQGPVPEESHCTPAGESRGGPPADDVASQRDIWAYRWIDEFFDLVACQAELGWMDLPIPRGRHIPAVGSLVALIGDDGSTRCLLEAVGYLGKIKAPPETRKFWHHRGYRKAIFPRLRSRFIAERIPGLNPVQLNRLKASSLLHIGPEVSTLESPGVGHWETINLPERASEVEGGDSAPQNGSEAGSATGDAGDPPGKVADGLAPEVAQANDPPAIESATHLEVAPEPQAPLDSSRSDWVRTTRKQLALTQAEYGKLVGVTQTTVSAWERGVVIPTDAYWERIVASCADASTSLPRGAPVAGRLPAHPFRPLSPVERNRRLLRHFARFGEATSGELRELGVSEDDLANWLTAFITHRPGAFVATPLFLDMLIGDADPPAFVSHLASRFLGEHLDGLTLGTMPEIESHVWSTLGRWRLQDVTLMERRDDAYLRYPVNEPLAQLASERLDLFAQLPHAVIAELVRIPEFLEQQRTWCAAVRTADGPLSRQLSRSWRRPLFLSHLEIEVDDDGCVGVGGIERGEVTRRQYVVAGLALCSPAEASGVLRLDRESVAEQLLQHPVAAAIVQFEVHRLFAGLSREPTPSITLAGGMTQLELDGVTRGPLWRHLRWMLEQVGYWPVGASTQDSSWVTATEVMVANLALLDVMERDGKVLRLAEAYESKIKAHPGHPQNRGEKPYRVRLAQYLATLHGGLA